VARVTLATGNAFGGAGPTGGGLTASG